MDPDLLIIGSGPIGSTFARVVAEARPKIRILMVDAGPQLTPIPGVHVRNISADEDRVIAQARSQGPRFTEERIRATAAAVDRQPDGTFARPGTFYVDPDAAALNRDGSMPAAALSSNVGGMGAHWTCACPRPDTSELVPFVPQMDWDRALRRAERLMCVTQRAFPPTRAGAAILKRLSDQFDLGLPADRRVQPMPLACCVERGSRYWSGTDVILGPLASEASARFNIAPETLCAQLVVEGRRVVLAKLRDLRSGTLSTVQPKVVVAACDGLRTPQLLWASGIRPRALGHYLNDHLQVMAAARLKPEAADEIALAMAAVGYAQARRVGADAAVGVFWIPYSSRHPFHGQVMHFGMSPISLGLGPSEHDDESLVGVSYYVPKQIRFEDRVAFSESSVDAYGMPRMQIDYALTEQDRNSIEAAKRMQARAVAALGEFVPGREGELLALGSSLHYQGTIRMGDTNDGHSVCDASCRVWDLDNLFLGGNGVLPTSTAGNPTLSSVAHAVRTAEELTSLL